MGADRKKPTQVLASLYDEGVRMRLDDEGKLKARLEGGGKLTPNQRNQIKDYKPELTKLVTWDEDRADKMAGTMLRVAWQGYKPHGQELVELNAALEGARALYNEGHAMHDMGLVRWAAYLFVKRAKSIRRRWEKAREAA